MVAAALIMLVQLDRTDTIIAFIIIGREITISALREWMAKIGAAKSVAVSMLGKVKTAPDGGASRCCSTTNRCSASTSQVIGRWLIWIAAVLTLWSMVYYLRMAWPDIAEAQRRKSLGAVMLTIGKLASL
jgi:cardiolipin synthase